MQTQQIKGFTLIELVVVIVILGILAATALPKFVDLGKDARITKVKAMEGALRSTANLWQGVCQINNCPSDAVAIITYQGKKVWMWAGYPDAGNTIGSDPTYGNQIDGLVDTTGYDITLLGSGTHQFVVQSAKTPDNCRVTYTQVQVGITTYPKITPYASDC